MHHAFISIFIALWAVITHYVTMLMPFLSYFTSSHEEGECRQLGFWAGKGANIRDIFCTTPNVLKLHKSQFWNILKILGEESTGGGHPPSKRVGARPTPLGVGPLPRGPPGRPPVPIFGYMVCFDLEKKSKGSFRDEAPPSRGGTWAEPI